MSGHFVYYPRHLCRVTEIQSPTSHRAASRFNLTDHPQADCNRTYLTTGIDLSIDPLTAEETAADESPPDEAVEIAADEAAAHHNWPAAYEHTMVVNSVRMAEQMTPHFGKPVTVIDVSTSEVTVR